MGSKVRNESLDCISEIKHVIAQEVSALQEQVNEAQEYARRYFAPPNDENIMPFYADERRADICNRSEDSFSPIDVESQEVSFGHQTRETQDQGGPIESDE